MAPGRLGSIMAVFARPLLRDAEPAQGRASGDSTAGRGGRQRASYFLSPASPAAADGVTTTRSETVGAVFPALPPNIGQPSSDPLNAL